ncbi:hypothetical protein I3843_11G062600 [Carya illinoinensis]|nr:hypothetical protein I3843_11G062600 [Carya illinoinensis]
MYCGWDVSFALRLRSAAYGRTSQPTTTPNLHALALPTFPSPCRAPSHALSLIFFFSMASEGEIFFVCVLFGCSEALCLHVFCIHVYFFGCISSCVYFLGVLRHFVWVSFFFLVIRLLMYISFVFFKSVEFSFFVRSVFRVFPFRIQVLFFPSVSIFFFMSHFWHFFFSL